MVPEQMIELEQSVLQLPKDFLKTPTTAYQSGHWDLEWSADLAAILQAQATEPEARSWLLAGFTALLYRYTQQSAIGLDITLANPQVGSGHAAAIETSIDDRTTAQGLVQHWADCLAQLASELPAPAQDSTEGRIDPALPVAVSFVAAGEPIEGESIDLEALQQTAATRVGQRELHLVILESADPGHPLVRLHYDASLFRLDTIQRLVGHWQVLLAAMAENSNCPIVELSLLTPAERQQLTDWRSPTVGYPEIPMHRRIEALAAAQPDAIALSFCDQQLTYAELNQRANQLAHYLASQGVGPGVAVAVCVQPCLEILVSLLGVFKVGGVYVPLDPTYPAERQGVIFADTQPQVLLTQSDLVSQLPPVAASVLCFDRDGFDSPSPLLQTQPTDNPVQSIDLDRTAYLVYTSGTTGKPKGVMVSHRNLINYILVAQERFGFNAQDVLPAIARFTFSITMFELLSPLVAGGRLVILEREHILDFQRMVQTLQQVTVVHSSPSLMKKLLIYIQEQGLEGQFPNLRHASCGGDMVSADLLETMKAVFHNAEIFVVYGCSEISCMGCTYPVARDRPLTRSRVGQPFTNVSVRLLDRHQHPVPIGVPGEIWFGGAGVTLGYLHRPDLTQEKFVTIEGDRFYRTGDLGRWDTEGNLEILGRNDFQIQLRGMRIEPGEIETTLRQAGVREAVVMGRQLSNSELALVAYVVLAPGQAIATLRQTLQSKLPDYMVPALFVPLEAMPLTPNGKLDRRSLPAPDVAHPGTSSTESVAPRTELEAQIAAIWARILGLESVSIHDDFFALGGHSLLATQVIYRLRESLQLQIPISQLFESPTVAQLAGQLAPLIKTTPSQPQESRTIVPVSRQRDLPLSISQRGLWFLSQLEEGRTLNIPLGIRLMGSLDIPALEQSLSEIVRRHEPLRTVFPLVRSAPVQRILPPAPLQLPIVNLEPLSAADQEAKIHQLGQAAAQYPFNLAVDQPLHVTLLRLHPTAHVLLITIHHIAADGWSLAVLRRELAALYSAFAQGQPSPLPELAIQYADFVHWQQQWLQGQWLTSQFAYWQQQLAGAPPILELPTDRPRPSTQSFNGGAAFFQLDATLTQRLRDLSQRTGTTLFMTLLAAFGTLLSRYSRQSDLVIGSPIANRPRSEVEPLIGFFINVLALRLDLTGNPDFLTLLQRVRRVSLDAYANQDVPFGQVVDTVLPDRDRGYSPLFQVMFILQNSPAEVLQLPGLTLSPLHTESGTSQYDLWLMMEETPAGLEGEFEYNSDLFDAATMARMVDHFQTLLQAIVLDPAQPIARLPLLSAVERQCMVQLGSQTERPYPQQCIHQLFEIQVQRTPDALALVAESESAESELAESEPGSRPQQLTYRELNQRANQLAHYLQTLGVGPEVLVAIVMERSIDLLVSILAVLKAGGAYVPIDPAYTSDRQSYQLADSGAVVILTQPHLATALPSTPAAVVSIDAAWEQIDSLGAAYQIADLPTQTTPQNLAYIIYTSGSTGNPKGVMIQHQGVVNHALSSAQSFELTPADRVLQFSSMGFDIFVEEVFPTLISGATLVLRSDEVALSIRAFCQFAQRHAITVLDIPTAFWHELVNGLALLQKTLPACVRLVVVGGEKASRSAYQQWRHLTRPQVRWLNTYGPTEATVTTTLFDPIQEGFDPEGGEIPIGRAIANLQTYILDDCLQPVPIGVPGELHIGGAGVARGYLNQPEKSQEKFIPDPFSPDPAARLYKTGDIAYYLPNGNLAFIGRSDYQVKVRGFRIELGEIETCLEQHPDVQQAVVLVRQDEAGQKLLAGYVVTPDPASLTASDLHRFLQSKLPPYMVPSVWVVLKNFPLTANGKVDRRALPAPVPVQREAIAAAGITDATEQRLIEIWEAVLGVQPIHPEDNFFDLGGHSLLSIQLFARIEQAFNQALPPTVIFQASTVRAVAALLDPSAEEPPKHSAIVIQAGKPSHLPLFCIHVLGPNCQFFRPLMAHLDPAQPAYGLAAQMLDRENAPPNRIPDLARYYIQEMQQIQPHGPYYLAGVSFGGCVAFEMACQLVAQKEPVALLALLDTFAPNTVDTKPSAERVSAHFDRLVKLGPIYLLKRAFAKLQRVQDKLLARLGRWLQRQGYTVPYKLGFLMVLEENISAATQYIPGIYPGRITLFRATEGVFYSQSYLDAGLGWHGLTSQGLQVHDVPGDHMQMLQDPAVVVLAEKLQAELNQSFRSRDDQPW
jgi:amino acid adenylation domain-containing protein